MPKKEIKSTQLNIRWNTEQLKKLDDLCVAYGGLNRSNVLHKLVEGEWLRITKKGLKETAEINKQLTDMMEKLKQYAEK